MKPTGFVVLVFLSASPSLCVGVDELVPRIRSAVTASGGHFIAAVVEISGRIECRGTDPDPVPVCATRATIIRMVAGSPDVDTRARLGLSLQVESVELNKKPQTLLVFTTPASWTNRVVIALTPTPENVDAMRNAVDLVLRGPVKTEQQGAMPNEPLQRPSRPAAP